MIILGCTNRQIHFRNGEIHSFLLLPKIGFGLQTPIVGFKELGLGTSSCTWIETWSWT
jgi:hypothetical protein